MSRAPKYDPPTTIQVVRPERTIVSNVDHALLTVLADPALRGASFVLFARARCSAGSSNAPTAAQGRPRSIRGARR